MSTGVASRWPWLLLCAPLWAGAQTLALRLDREAPPAALAAPAPGEAAGGSAQALLDEPRRCDDATAAAPDPLRPWTLGDAIVVAICRAPLVRQGGAGVLQADAARLLAQGRWQPAVTLSAGADRQQRYGVDSTAVVRLDWVLFDFGQRSALNAQAGQALAAALDEQRAEVLNAVAQAALLYTTAQAAQGRLDAAVTNLRTALESQQLAEARRDAGAASLAERYRAETTVAQARVEHARAQSGWLSARGSLAVALGLRARDALELADASEWLSADVDIDLAALIDEARERHPKVRAARARLQEAQSRVDAIQNERWGNVGMVLQSGRTRSSSDAEVRGFGSASIGWTLPLFDRESVAARRGDAVGQTRSREALLDDALAQVEAQVWEQGRTWLGERAARRESLRALDSARAALRITTERYRLGVGSFSDLLAAQSAAASALNQSVDAQAAEWRARLRLSAAVGRLGPLGPVDPSESP